MHENANIVFRTQETHALIMTVLEVQPRMASSGGGKTSDEIVYDLAENILNRIPEKLDIETASPELFEVSTGLWWDRYGNGSLSSPPPPSSPPHASPQPDEKGQLNSLSTVLSQEVDRFNNLLRVIKVGWMRERVPQIVYY